MDDVKTEETMRERGREDKMGGGGVHTGVFGGWDITEKDKKTTEERKREGNKYTEVIVFDHCGYVVAVVREREKRRAREQRSMFCCFYP